MAKRAKKIQRKLPKVTKKKGTLGAAANGMTQSRATAIRVSRGADRKVRKQELLEALTEYRTVSAACQAIGLHRGTAFTWKRDDPEFAAEWEEAVDARRGADTERFLDDCLDGIPEVIIYQGEIQKDPETNEPVVVRKKYPHLMVHAAKATLPGMNPDKVEGIVPEDLAKRLYELWTAMKNG